MSEAPDPGFRLIGVELDPASIGLGTPDQEHERRVAIFDLVQSNHFEVPGHDSGGPYRLRIALQGPKLALTIRAGDGTLIIRHLLSLTPLRSILRDYLLICDAHASAVNVASRSRIEAIDMGRRALHDQAAALLAERLTGKITADFDTMRRLFTLITALHWKG